MNTIKKPFSKEHAQVYDEKAEESKWLDPELVFGLIYKYLKPGESILDVGIGTGLSSALLQRIGLQVYGIDVSPDMLEVCRAKQIATDLKEHDLLKTPYPFQSASIQHAVSVGVMHILSDLTPVFQEVARILKQNGLFAFVVADCSDGTDTITITRSGNGPSKTMTFFGYSGAVIEDLLVRFGFAEMRQLKYNGTSIGRQSLDFRAYVVRKLS